MHFFPLMCFPIDAVLAKISYWNEVEHRKYRKEQIMMDIITQTLSLDIVHYLGYRIGYEITTKGCRISNFIYESKLIIK
jgi:hypothetical protein